ncbi:hypothetical protein DSO57_1035495 [Entomophthora muscae]|uniref:Uncharacterized protein n=1 Tax=Entomophthora muscae TaxID=34485 RepID=A0ACC2TA78_9FUNG|nr:hypothetical protein DSO57_1035495 [Entomophthora muscae]
MEGFNRLLKLMVAQDELIKNGHAERESFLLRLPRPDYGISSDTMYFYLQHSLLSMCKPAELQSNTCFCEGKVVDAKLFGNETLDSQAIVAVDVRNKLILVSYRMSVSEKNWDTNYKHTLVKHPPPKAPIQSPPRPLGIL